MNRRLIGYFLITVLFSGCTEPAENEQTTEKTGKVRLTTSKGDIVIELDDKKAPVTVANFKKYVTDGFYNGTVFHRVIDGFMIQGGGFAQEDNKLVEKKTGTPIVNESKNGLKNEIFTIAMARTNEPDSATSQFFINVADNDRLNFPSYGGYAVFGKVIEGMDVVNQIKTVETGDQILVNRDPRTDELVPDHPDVPSENVPIEPVLIISATLE